MVKSKLKYGALGLLCAFTIANTAYAADEYFWSDSEYLPPCGSGIGGYVISNGKRIEMETPTCEEAKKTRVMVVVNGKYLQPVLGSGADPFIENGRIMIPLRAIADAFGFEVDWVQSEQKITLKKDGKNIIMHIGKSDMLVDGKEAKFEEAVPMMKNDLTFLPARQLAEILGIKVEWDNDKRTATFTSK